MQDECDPRGQIIPVTVDVDGLVLEASRAAVRRMAPEELEVFDPVSAAWRERVGRRDWSTPGGSVGFGIDSTLVTELILPAAAAALGDVFSGTVHRARSGWRRWRRGRGGSPAGVTLTTWSTEDEARLREAAGKHAVALGLSAAQADILADALVGALRSSAGQPPSPAPPSDPPAGNPPAADPPAADPDPTAAESPVPDDTTQPGGGEA